MTTGNRIFPIAMTTVLAAVLGASAAAYGQDAEQAPCVDTEESACQTLAECPDADGVACTVAMRDDTGACVEVDACTETCRPATYWASHAGVENGGENLVQQAIDAAGPFVVCGHMLRTTEAGSLASALEALCVRIDGLEERQLFRQLVTTNLNCAISEGGRCDQILERFIDVSFSDCNNLCAGEPVKGGPSAQECTRQLSCFNDGGRVFDGQCATGTCGKDSLQLCGADHGNCAGGKDCVRFDDTCAYSPVCSADLEAMAGICPANEKDSSADICQVARNNACTLDDCR